MLITFGKEQVTNQLSGTKNDRRDKKKAVAERVSDDTILIPMD